MWWIEYEDYAPEKPLKKFTVEPGKGIIGCEMHELNGWGTIFDLVSPKIPPSPNDKEHSK